MSDYITIKDAASEFHASTRQLWRLIATGKIKVRRGLGRRVLLRRAELVALIEAGRQ